jgi:putative molybdopterin biosynthesis protein
MSQNKSLSIQEVAEILHVSKSTIYGLIKKGEIHSYTGRC